MKDKLFRSVGMSMLSLPVGKRECSNEKKRAICDLEGVSASQMISAVGLRPNCPTILCGAYNKSCLLLRQMLRMSRLPVVLVETERDLEMLPLDVHKNWEKNHPVQMLPDNDGVLRLSPNVESVLELKECLSGWGTHMIVLFIGTGLQLDAELMDLLNAHGNYILMTNSLFRGIKSSEGSRLSPADVLSSMDYIVISSIGAAARELVAVLPTYESEQVTSTADVSLFSRSPRTHNGSSGRHRGGSGNGLSLSQSRSLETKPILSQDDLRKMQDENVMLLYNVKEGHTYTARLIR